MTRFLRLISRTWGQALLPAVLALLFSCGPSNSHDSGSSPVVTGHMELNLDIAAEGDLVTTTVKVKNAKDLYGAALDLVYDPAVLEYQSADEGALFKTGGATNFAAALQNKKPERLVIGCSLIGQISGANGSYAIAVASFKQIATGAMEIKMENVLLLDSKQNIIFNQQ